MMRETDHTNRHVMPARYGHFSSKIPTDSITIDTSEMERRKHNSLSNWKKKKKKRRKKLQDQLVIRVDFLITHLFSIQFCFLCSLCSFNIIKTYSRQTTLWLELNLHFYLFDLQWILWLWLRRAPRYKLWCVGARPFSIDLIISCLMLLDTFEHNQYTNTSERLKQNNTTTTRIFFVVVSFCLSLEDE